MRGRTSGVCATRKDQAGAWCAECAISAEGSEWRPGHDRTKLRLSSNRVVDWTFAFVENLSGIGLEKWVARPKKHGAERSQEFLSLISRRGLSMPLMARNGGRNLLMSGLSRLHQAPKVAYR